MAECIGRFSCPNGSHLFGVACCCRDASLTSDVAGVARWLLTYRAGDGQLETVRMEVYKPGSD